MAESCLGFAKRRWINGWHPDACVEVLMRRRREYIERDAACACPQMKRGAALV
jgi:hypothetical protein